MKERGGVLPPLGVLEYTDQAMPISSSMTYISSFS